MSTDPWPGKASTDDYQLGGNWYSDSIEAALFIKDQQGAKTISKYKKEFLLDWAERWKWLGNSLTIRINADNLILWREPEICESCYILQF